MPSPSKRPRVISAHTAFAHEPALLAIVASFVPAASPGDGASRARATLETITALCRAFPVVASRVAPSNASFWRAMVLANFDFEVDPEGDFNVEDEDDYWEIWRDMMVGDSSAQDRHPYDREEGESPEEEEEKKEEEEKEENEEEEDDDDDDDGVDPVWHKHPARAAIQEMGGDDDSCPDQFLKEDMEQWSNLRVYFRPAEYGFLGQIQRGEAAMSSWPDKEDAFTLYLDLLVLQERYASFEEQLHTSSDGEQFVEPCLLGRFDGEIVGRGYAFLKHLDILPHYWYGIPAVSRRWDGFDDPTYWELYGLSSIDEKLNEPDRTNQEHAIFPDTSYRDTLSTFNRLRRLVFETCYDWRRVRLNFDEYPSPDFFVGKSKRSGRWLGFVGQSDHYRGW